MPDYGYNSEEEKQEDLKECVESWTAWLKDFKENVYPIFHEHNLTLAAALQIYEIRTLTNNIVELKELLEDNKWKNK